MKGSGDHRKTQPILSVATQLRDASKFSINMLIGEVNIQMAFDTPFVEKVMEEICAVNVYQ